MLLRSVLFFFFNDTATTEIYTLSLHDALPIRTRATSAQNWMSAHSCPATTPDSPRPASTTGSAKPGLDTLAPSDGSVAHFICQRSAGRPALHSTLTCSQRVQRSKHSSVRRRGTWTTRPSLAAARCVEALLRR